MNSLSDQQLSLLSVASGHSTWARTFKCKPSRYLAPSTLEEIQSIVITAVKYGHKINVVGSGHSPSHMTMNQGGWIVSLDNYNKVLNFEEHANYTDVTVQAGIRIHQLNDALYKQGLALQNLGSISEQSIAGAISTGTHGASAYHGLLSNQLVNLTIVDGNGAAVFCDENTNSDIFKAGLCSLGKLGIIVQATFRVVPKFRLKYTQEVVEFEKLVSSEMWPSVWTSAEFIRIWWFPYCEKVILWRADRAPPDLKETKPLYSFYGTSLGRFFYETLLFISTRLMPSLTPAIERWVFKRQYGNETTTAVRNSVEGFNMDCLFSQFVNEWAVPMQNGRDVLLKLREIIRQAEKSKSFYVHSPFEVRVSNTSFETPKARDDFTDKNGELVRGFSNGERGAIPGSFVRPYLDPTPMAEYSNPPKIASLALQLNATIYRPFGFNTPIDKWYQQFEHVVYTAGGKPHWAKNFLGPNPSNETNYKPKIDGEMRGLAPWISDLYKDNLTKWRRVRETCDPHGVFLPNNDWAKINGLLD